MKENKRFRLRRVPKDYDFQFLPFVYGYKTKFMDCVEGTWECISWGYWEFYFGYSKDE